MECNISFEEFQRLQEDLLRLRGDNYSLQEENRKILNELKTLKGSKENERINPLEALTPRKFSDFRRRFLKADDGESSPSDSSIKTVSTQEDSIQKQNESLQQELTLLTEINQNLQKQIEALTNQNASSEGGMSPVEIQMLSQDRVDFMVKIEDLRKVIDSLHLENSNLTSSLKASEEMRQQMQSDFERLQKSCQQMSNDKDIILLESNSSQSKCAVLESQISTLNERLEEQRQMGRAIVQKHKNEIQEVVEKSIQKQSELDEAVQNLQEKSNIIFDLENKLENLQVVYEDVQTQLEESQKREAEFNGICDKIRSELIEEHKTKVATMEQEAAVKLKEKETEIELVTAQLNEMESIIQNLRQELIDAAEDKKLEEKKGIAALRDLKRQLQAEKKRAEKLQERIKDLHDSSRGDESMSNDIDRYSMFSWSGMSENGQRTTSRPKSSISDTQEPLPLNSSPVPGDRGEGTIESICDRTELSQHVAMLEQENAILEEKVRHLEINAAATADELLRRGKLIQQYCMDGGRPPSKAVAVSHKENPVLDKLTEKMSGMFMRSNSTKNDDRVQQMLRLLEETLMKNVQLQEGIEKLVEETEKLKSLSKENISG
ncbi:GRIP1-associated protein 1-like isoform X1 [Artemia franciscana]|uniref:GRIP1-associated protein 1 n=2 Tax=Artemia franciscana TaxID=6661 RepID=A0AA88HUX3_ARTSF|nr:hypothetical protein QYM36_005743 [Artemia franciscana]